LLIRLQKKVPKRLRLLREWPAGPADLTWQTQRSVDHLHKVGVDVTFVREEKTGHLLIQMARLEPQSVAAAPCKPDDQQPLFAVEELAECARPGGGKRWR
jgi:hypothetical protein